MGDIYRDTPSSFDRNNPYQIGAEYFGIVEDSVDVELMKMFTKSFPYQKETES